MSDTSHKPEAPLRTSLKTDLNQFAHHLDGADLSDAQKQDLLEALWSLMIQFVDLGFGVSPTQNTCGQLKKSTDQAPRDSADQVQSKNAPNSFNNAAKDTTRQKGR